MDFLKRVMSRPGAEAGKGTDPENTFDQARALAGSPDARQIVLVRPDLSLLVLACPRPGSVPEAVVRQMANIVRPETPRKIAVVTATGSAPAGARAGAGSPAWTLVAKNLPFFGILNGLGYIGHTVWIFDGASAMGPACRDADILIVDSAVLPSIATSLDEGRGAMRGATVLIHDRETFQLRPAAGAVGPAAWADVFAAARANTSRGEQSRIVLVRPDCSLLSLPTIPRKSMTPEHLAQALRLIPEGAARNVAAIASTALPPAPAGVQENSAVAQLKAAGSVIPFFGLLLNLASAGNPVWIFDGQPESLVEGCRHADLLFIDSAVANAIPMPALDAAAAAMRSANMAVYDRRSQKLAMLRHISASKDRLEFRD